MAPRNQNQLQPSFDPSRDIDAYMSDKGEALRQRGLQKQSIRLYELLCRLCPPGESQLVYDQQADLVSDLKRLAPGESGLTEGSVSRKLNRLASLGFAAKSGGGQSNCPLVVDLYLPDLVAPKPPRPRKPAVVVSPSDERQGQFFDGGAAFRLVGADDEPPKAQSIAVSKAQPLALSVGESASDCAFEPARQEEPTSSPRTRVWAPAVDVVDVVVVASTVADFEVREARSALCRTIAAWRRARIPEQKWKPNRKNLSTWLKTHTLLLRGEISRDAFEQALLDVRSVHDSGEIEESTWAIMWPAWKKSIPGYTDRLCAMTLPDNWHEIMAGKTPVSAPQTPPKIASDSPEATGLSKEVREWERRAQQESAKFRARNKTGIRRPEAAPNGEEPLRE